jgi:succinoglycan biosynthesis transport protein ExoP
VDMRPPGGAEFGKTEVFYLSVRDTNRQRATALAAALCRQLEQRLQQLRDQRAQSMIAELARTVAMADGDLANQTERLSTFEANIGADLAELRSLTAQVGSQGGATQELQSIEAERRANESLHRENTRLLKLLTVARDDSQELLATPSSLLKSQPAVKQLKDALVAAQIRIANLLGSRSEKHPFVVAARDAEKLIRGQLHDEIAVAIRGLEVDVELGADREKALAAKWSAARARISRLAEARAEYANLVSSVENHTRLVEAARKNLADARARQAGALSASVISRIDGVEAGVRPVGPGRKTITMAGGVAGLLFGFGLVFLFANPASGGYVAAANVDIAEIENVAEKHVVVANGSRNGETHVAVTHGTSQSNGFFHGMTLEQAIRSVEQRG